METLLQRALKEKVKWKTRVNLKSKKASNKQEIELALAWLKNEVTDLQCNRVLRPANTTSTTFRTKFTKIIKDAYNLGIISINKE